MGTRKKKEIQEKSNVTYQDVQEELLKMISEMDPGTKLDSRVSLARRFSVNKTTLDHAVTELIGRGILYSKAKSGTYVAERSEETVVEETRPVIWTVIIPNIINDTYPEIYLGIQSVTDQRGIQLILKSTEEDAAREDVYLDSLDSKQIQGVIVIPTVREKTEDSAFFRAKEKGIPMVLCNRDIYPLDVPCVKSDNFLGGYLMTKHLISQGCKNIAFLSKYYYGTTYERYAGYSLALQEAGLDVRNELCIWSYDVERKYEGYEKTRELLQMYPEIDGIFCFNDRLAVGAISACIEMGRRVGKDIAVGGYDNSSICTNILPQITSVEFRGYDIGVQAAQYLCEEMERKTIIGKRKISLSPFLVERDSSHLTAAGKR